MDGAAALAQVEDVDGYQTFCRRMLERFGDTADPMVAERVAKSCLFYRLDKAYLPVASRLAELAVSLDKTHSLMPYFEFARGLAEYRNGNYDAAVRWCRQSRAGRAIWFRIAQCDLVLAMIHTRRGKLKEAQNALARARNAMKDRQRRGDHNWIVCKALLDEAETLLKKQPNSTPEEAQ